MLNTFTKTVFIICCLLFLNTNLSATCSPFTVSMASGSNNATAFTADGQIGVDGAATYFLHWDNTYAYFGWSGGRTNYSSDMYYVGIDVDPGDGNGTAAAIQGVDFDVAAMDYYVVYENNMNFYGAPASNGNAFELYENSGGAWNFVSRTGGDDGTTSQIDFQDGGGEVRLRIAWADLGGFTPGAANDIRFVMWTNNSDGNFGWSSFPSANPTGATNLTMTDGFTFASTAMGTCPATDASNAALPVEFGKFDARISDEAIQLDWNTMMELDNKHFELEKSKDTEEWETLAIIAGQGSSFLETNYQYLDKAPFEGLNYYRLKQVDLNGHYAYSETVSVEFQTSAIHVYPNPVSDLLILDTKKETTARVEIFNLQGQVLKSIWIENQERTEINVHNLPTGVYVLRLTDTYGALKTVQTIIKN